MSYKLTKSDGTLLTTVADYVSDTSTTSLTLLGRGVVNYGQLTAENFVYLLENFASPIPPVNPQIGQIWFQTTDDTKPDNPVTMMVIKVYTGDTTQGTPSGWMQVGGTNASLTPPSNPYTGELWYNINNSTLYVWNGSIWSAVSNTMSENPPSGAPSGPPADGTTWLMLPEHMLWIYDSSLSNPEPPFTRSGGSNDGQSLSGGWRLVGPQAPQGKGTYSAFSSVKDSNGNSHDVIINYIDNFPISISSPSTFTANTSAIPNFTTYGSNSSINIVPGININNGFTYVDGTPGSGILNGTSANSNLFSGNDTSKFLGRGDTDLPTTPASDNKTSFGANNSRWGTIFGTNICPGNSTVGTADTSSVNLWGKSQSSVTSDSLSKTINISMNGDVTGSGSSNGSSDFDISTSLSDSLKNQLAQMEQDIQKAQNSANANSGGLTQDAGDNRYIQLTGTGSRAVSGNLGSSTSNCFSTVYSTTFEGTATHSKYSDLAEYYNGDTKYSYGTLLKIGGSAEVTQTSEHADVEFFGVVSHEPGFVMNDDKAGLDNYVPVALSGRIPVRVIGKVTKGDRLVPSTVPGVAVSAGTMLDILALDTTERTLIQASIIGRSLVDKDNDEEGLVECYVQAR